MEAKAMKIVWVVNIAMADACIAQGKPAPVIGGWLTGYRDALLTAHPEVELHVVEPYWGAMPKQITTSWQKDDVAQSAVITHHLFPDTWITAETRQSDPMQSRLSAITNRMVSHFTELAEEIRPDAVHLHGTEFPHALAWIEANGTEHTIASIQGLAYEYAQVFMSGLSPTQQRRSFSDWRHGFSLAKDQAQLAERGKTEVTLLQRIECVAGRTQWDHDCTRRVNGQLRYFTLQEVLRQGFYDAAGSWDYSKCNPHSIFVSQSHYPIKGLHQLLKALPQVLAHYPDTQVRIVGHDISDKRWWQRSSYGNVLHDLIEANHLRSHLTFLGPLTAEQMIREYQRANMFVCPSRIENSCNSVCEAQLLGTPIIAARVGGMDTLIADGKTGLLYEYDDTPSLTEQICRLFADADLCRSLGNHGTTHAQQRHNRTDIARTLYNIYKELSL